MKTEMSAKSSLRAIGPIHHSNLVPSVPITMNGIIATKPAT